MSLQSTDLKKRLQLLKNLTLFAHVPESELRQFASLFHDVVFPAGCVIVQQQEIVDCVYIIVEGDAEVLRQKTLAKNDEFELLHVLHPGEAIGLQDSGFFSTTGMRTATVKALTPIFAVRLQLVELQRFMQEHPTILPTMSQATDDILFQTFIKQIEPFANVNPAILREIRTHIQKREVPANTILFQQGDHADCCYLLCSGQAEVILKKADGSESKIADLESVDLFGDMALLTNGLRNATVKTVSPCNLLVLQQNEFQKLVQNTSENSANSLTSLLMDRHRPLRCEGVTVHKREDAEKNTIVILKDAEKGIYVKTSEEGLFVWNLLDGEHTLQDIAVAYFYKFHKLAVETIGNLILNLMHSGFVQTPVLASYVPQTQQPRWMRFLLSLSNIMTYEYSVKNVDAWVTCIYQRGGYLFCTKIAVMLMSVIAIIGIGFFAGYLPQADVILKETPHAWVLLLLVLPTNLLTLPLHEMAHALATKSFGKQVHRFGIGWFWLGPMAFADTSDMWLCSRGPRIVVNLAGIFINVVISGILSMLAWCVSDPTLSVYLWLVALSSYLLAFYNLDPTFELDGYYVLMDAFDKPNLRTHATLWLLQNAKKSFRSFKLFRQYLPEISYWVITIIFITAIVLMAYVVQTYILNNMLPATIFGIEPRQVKWFLSAVLIMTSFASLYARVKSQANKLHETKSNA